MNFARRKETERFAFSFSMALLFHLAIFLVLYFGRFLLVEDTGGYLGPITVMLDEPMSLPTKTTGDTPQAPPQEQPKETEKTTDPASPDAEKMVETPSKQPDSLVGDAGKSDVLPAKTADTSETRVPDAAPASTEPLFKVQDAAPEEETYIFTDRDPSGGEVSIKMSRKSDKASPIIRLPVELPDFVTREGRKLEAVLSFVVAADGYLVDLHLDKSSGFEDVDNAIIASMQKWKLSNPTPGQKVVGTFTYRIN